MYQSAKHYTVNYLFQNKINKFNKNKQYKFIIGSGLYMVHNVLNIILVN